MKKIYKYVSVLLFSFIVLLNSVYAAGYTTSVTSTSVTIGGSITLNVKGSDVAGKFTVTTSDASIVSLSTNSIWIDNNSQTITLNTKKVGSAIITIVPTDVTSYDGKTITENKTIKITVNAKSKPNVNNNSGSGNKVPPKAKSSNSYLTSLTIDGYELESKFDKEVLEYSVTVKEGTEKIKINAQLADSTAKVTGTGEVTVSEGNNIFSLVVTAENGSKRTYKLNVNVLEYKPIKVKIENKEFTIVRKRKDLPVISEYFEQKDITIDGNIIEGYYNDTLNYFVVGLKDKTGNIKYYIYENDKYTLYNEQVFNGKVLRIIDKKLEGGYRKTNFNYNNNVIDSYQEVKIDILKNTYALNNDEITGNDFYLFYAINLETGKEELYQYDSLEKTVQRYNTLILDMYKKQKDKYYLYLLSCILILGIVVITFSTILITKGKKKKKKNKKKKFEIELEETDDLAIKKQMK